MVAEAVVASPIDWAPIAIAAARNSDIRRYITPMMRRPSPLVLCLVLCATASPVLAASKLIDAIKRGDVNAVRTLIAQKADVNAPDADGSTPLHWATQRDDMAMADVLIAAGAN